MATATMEFAVAVVVVVVVVVVVAVDVVDQQGRTMTPRLPPAGRRGCFRASAARWSNTLAGTCSPVSIAKAMIFVVADIASAGQASSAFPSGQL